MENYLWRGGCTSGASEGVNPGMNPRKYWQQRKGKGKGR